MRRVSPSARREEIVATAVQLLDDEGLDGLSLRRLSQRTGASATSVYWYVKNKDELLALTLDAVITEVQLPDIAQLGWREAAAQMARGFRAMVLHHPWLGLVVASYPTVSGRQLARHSEHALTVYEAAGFDTETADYALGSVYSFVVGAAIGEAGVRAWRPTTGAADGHDPLSAEALEHARVVARGLPRLTARINALRNADITTMNEIAFEFGLQAILDGLEARLQVRQSQPW